MENRLTFLDWLTGGCVAGVDMPELLPCGYLVGDSTNIAISLKGVNILSAFFYHVCAMFCYFGLYHSRSLAYSCHPRSVQVSFKAYGLMGLSSIQYWSSL